MFTYGVMQGRLTEPKGRGIQFFPVENWMEEFVIAKQIGLDEIEFIFDYYDYEKNPLWTKKGIEEVKKVIRDTDVSVNSICFDYFMREPFFKANNEREKEKLYKKNKMFLEKIMEASVDLGIKVIEIPLVDDSLIGSSQEKKMFREFLLDILKNKGKNNVFLGLETDFPSPELREYIESFDSPLVKANFDTGNSAASGYDVYEEITILRGLIYNIHLKDRVFNGGTVQLGSGDVDFKTFFKVVVEIDYSGCLVLQAARGADGCEKETIKEQLKFIKEYVSNFSI